MKNWKKAIVFSLSSLLAFGSLAGAAEPEQPAVLPSTVEEIVSGMTLDEKISQMIIPAIRTWDEVDVTDLEELPALAEALRAHAYGGIILFAPNVTGTRQTAKLIHDLQANQSLVSGIPYFLPVDQEGGIVTRLGSGTRMTGNMAIGATGEAAEENARLTGEIIGQELAALGFNIDFAPDIDVNDNPANPVIGTRSFSDDAETVAKLGAAYAEGLSQSRIIPTYKHFPGHGDTMVDSHIGTPSVEKTYEELAGTELLPFQKVIDEGAEMIMTAHITYPMLDDEMVYGDGETKGFYPATMSKKILTDILRGDMGYEGLVVTDALEMDAIRTAGLVPGETDSTEYRANVAEKAIVAGVDLLLIPGDLKDQENAGFYDEYIRILSDKVTDGTIPMERIDESVSRILNLKEKYGILKLGEAAAGQDLSLEERTRKALEVVGSEANHEAEMAIARQAVTLIRNENAALPLTGEEKSLVLFGRNTGDDVLLTYMADRLRSEGAIAEDAQVTIDYYYDTSGEAPAVHYPDEVKAAVSGADAVIAISTTWSVDALQSGSPMYQGLRAIMDDTHAGGGKFVLLSDNLPYDVARYQDADAILLAYMGSGTGLDPTERSADSTEGTAYNANVIAALETIFGLNAPTGTLPVDIPSIQENEDGTVSYAEENLYERGFGLGLS